jgi:hypothetical protein
MKKTVKEQSATANPVRYIANVGLNCGVTTEDLTGLRIEAGEDVPSWVIEQSGWLLDQGIVQVVVDESAPVEVVPVGVTNG